MGNRAIVLDEVRLTDRRSKGPTRVAFKEQPPVILESPRREKYGSLKVQLIKVHVFSGAIGASPPSLFLLALPLRGKRWYYNAAT
jgi:hypothetical protein